MLLFFRSSSGYVWRWTGSPEKFGGGERRIHAGQLHRADPGTTRLRPDPAKRNRREQGEWTPGNRGIRRT